MITRRRFLQLGAAAGMSAAVPWSRFLRTAHGEPLVQKLSNPALQPKFVELAPNALDPGFKYIPASDDSYTVGVGPTIQETGLVNPGGKRLSTRLFGYGQNGEYTWPGKTFEVQGGSETTTRVTWQNNLFKQKHLLSVDTSLHWAYSLPGYQHYSINKDGIPIAVHLHGGNSDFEFDGNPEFFFSPGGAILGPQWAKAGYGAVPTFEYNNDVPAGNLWYHDHALGITRLNVYAGLAGFYFVRDEYDPGTLLQSNYDLGLPKYPYELAYAIQDRMFKKNGDLFYPAFPSDPFWDDFIRAEGLSTGVVPKPSALAEFFGDHMVVNGKIWPKADVEPRNYRLRLLNGTDSRFMVIRFRVAASPTATDLDGASAPLPFYVIGSDQGLASSANMTDTLVFEPGGRYDIVFDFSDPKLSGMRVIMENIGGDAPFGGDFGDALAPEDLFPNRQTDRIMAFDVTIPFNYEVADIFDPETFDWWATALGFGPQVGDSTEQTRKVALFEGKDEFGRLQPLLGTVNPDNTATAYTWFQDTTENPVLNSTEDWEIYNFTGDAHPIHLHLVNFQIMGRNEIEFTEGDSVPVLQHNGEFGEVAAISNISVNDPVTLEPANGYAENAPKDMVTALPGQVVKIKAHFNKSGRYVWHCHILSHEDHEMMRVLQVG